MHKMTRKFATAIVSVVVCTVCATGFALYTVGDKGEWPRNWPKELERLRKKSQTYVGEMSYTHYSIPFTKRDEFESVWPHILKVKSPGAPLFLVRGKNFFLDEKFTAGVVVHCPPRRPANNKPEGPIPDEDNPRVRWSNTITVELIVDAEIIDLNRISLPAETPIIDERFKNETGDEK